MLLSNDVLDMMSQRAMLLAQTTVLASLVSPPAHEVPRGPIHLLLNFRFQVQTRLDVKDGDEIRCIDQRLVFRAFAIAKGAVVPLLRKRVDALLHWGVNLQIDDPTCGLHIQAAA